VTNCNALPIEFPGFGGRKIEADFGGGQVTSDGGVLLLRQVDRWIGLTKRLGALLPDRRDPERASPTRWKRCSSSVSMAWPWVMKT
jgi:DDE family transposase